MGSAHSRNGREHAVGGNVAATLLCWLLLTVGYSTDAQLQREYRRGGTHSAGDTAMRIITLPWHALRGLPRQ